MVCIIDDREDVWKFAPNLITVKKYIYFQGTGDINAPPGSREAQMTRKGKVLTHIWSFDAFVEKTKQNNNKKNSLTTKHPAVYTKGEMYNQGCTVQGFVYSTLHIPL